MMPRPRLRVPLDKDDRATLGTIAVYSLLVLWVALLLGTAVRLFLTVGFGGV